MGRAMFPPCCLTGVQIMVEVDEDNGDLLQKVPCTHCYTQCPQPWSRPPPAHASAGDSWTLTGNLGQSLLGSLLLSPGSWCPQGSLCALQESVSPVLCKFWQFCGGLLATSSKRAYALLEQTKVCCTQSPCPCGRPLLSCISTGDTQTQLGLSFCGVSGSWCTQGLFEPSRCL